jgi:hypothetical protein
VPAGPCEYLRAIARSAVQLGKASNKKRGGQGWRRRSGVSQVEEEQKGGSSALSGTEGY